jgi:uncharacterized DUF497 family protein
MQFEWSPEKAAKNLQKHKVSFDEATTVFGDPLSISAPDRSHSQTEHRYIIIGMSSRGRPLLVAYTERSALIRLISARTLTRTEKREYAENFQ